jgi:LDH2 family malate/lactate/ureidoglycolate dehydrogenase
VDAVLITQQTSAHALSRIWANPRSDETNPALVQQAELRRFVRDLFEALGAPPGRFQAVAEFVAAGNAMTNALRNMPADPGEEVLVPGDLEQECAEYSDRVGIPLRLATVDRLGQVADAHGVAPLSFARLECPACMP